MNSKIVILDDSVILYQHYINNDDWESVMAFPRGGLTYLIKNNNIKFYAYIDYFYRNCLMTMDLPLYIVDEELGIDGEYDDIEEITEILNRIFPANSDRDLSLYLRKSEAAETYQPIGDYQPSGDYFDDVEYDESGKTIDFYSQGVLIDSLDATKFIKDGMVDTVSLIELSGDTYLHIVFNTDAGKEPIDINLGDLFDADNYYTKAEADETFQPIGDYLTKESGDTLYQPVGDYALRSELPEVPSLDGYATETWVKNQGYINQIKTINNISLVGEGNINIGSGGTYVDSYSKEESDAKYQPKGEYVTSATFITYITNLQQQLDSIIEAVSGCCSSSGETIYRWITMTGENDYICSGTTKYAKEKKQQSTDNGMTWTDVSPAQYQRGTVIEAQSSDCGYEPTIEYRWVTVSGGYVCSGTTKYNQEKQQYRIDGGSWIDTDPLQTRRGSTVIETQSTDCGYIAPQYRWYQASASDYICSGTSKYYKEYYQVSNDGGKTWTNVSPTQTRTGALIEAQSTDCGYEPTPTSVTTSNLTYNVTSGANTEIIHSSVSASTLEVQLTQGTYTSIDLSGGTQKYATFTYTSNNAPGRLGHKTNWLSHSMFWRIPLTSINVGEGIVYIDDQALTNCSSLTSITLPSTITGWTSNGIANDSALTTVTVNATTPPTIANETLNIYLFTGCPNLTAIKVPASAVDTYKNDASWGRYANIIQPIS